MSDIFLAKQLSGPLAQGTISALENFYSYSDAILSYWYGLSISTASDADLTSIGYLVGLPWPSAPSGTFSNNSFTLGSALSYPTIDAVHGFSGVSVSTGGYLSSALPSSNNLVPDPVYRHLLAAVAIIRWSGISWSTIDLIASSFGILNYIYKLPQYYTFQLGSAATYPTVSTTHGLSGVGLTTGGRLTSVNPSYYPDSDITIAYITPLSNGYLWVAQQVFSSICTSPQVFVQNGA